MPRPSPIVNKKPSKSKSPPPKAAQPRKLQPYRFDPTYAGPLDWWRSPDLQALLEKRIDLTTGRTIGFHVGVVRNGHHVGLIAAVAISIEWPEAPALNMSQRIAFDPDSLDYDGLAQIPEVSDYRACGPFVETKIAGGAQ